MHHLPTEQELLELPRRAIVFLAAECLSQVESCYRLPEATPEREFYQRCLASVAASGKKFAAGEEIDPHEAPGMAAASVLSGLKHSSFADARQQKGAADSAGAARLVALAIARAKSDGQRATEDAARYAAEAIKLAVSAANESAPETVDALLSRIAKAFGLLRTAGFGQAGELGRAISASEFERLLEPDGAND